jgi:hypothetical protein
MRSALALRRFHSTAFERRSFRKPRGSPAWGRCCDKKKYGETKVYGDYFTSKSDSIIDYDEFMVYGDSYLVEKGGWI